MACLRGTGAHLLKFSRCLLDDAGVPGFLWGEVCPTAVYTYSAESLARCPGWPPHVSSFREASRSAHLRVTGARAIVHNDRTRTSKIESTAWVGPLVGYGGDSKTYSVYNPARKWTIRTRNVTFSETPGVVIPPPDECTTTTSSTTPITNKTISSQTQTASTRYGSTMK